MKDPRSTMSRPRGKRPPAPKRRPPDHPMGERFRYVYGPTIDIAKIITTPKVIEEMTHSTLQELADVSGYTPEEVLYGVLVHTAGELEHHQPG